MTVSEMLTLAGYLLNDTNEEVWSSTIKLSALNSAQRDLVLSLLGYKREYSDVLDLLSEIQEKETQSVGTSGFNLDNMVERYFLRNGYINSSILDQDDVTRWIEKIATSKMGITENRYFEGTTRDPKCRITANTYHLLITVGNYPRNVDFYYVGQPYTLATTASGTGKTQLVATCELNPLMHDLVVLMAEVKLRRMRGSDADFQQAQIVSAFVAGQISLLVTGAQGEPEARTVGQFVRKQAEFMQGRTQR